MTPSAHRIRRHTLDLHFSGSTHGVRLRSEAEAWQKKIWLPLLERALDEYDVEGKTVRIDRLEIDLAGLDTAHWQEAAGAEARDKLEAVLRRKLAEAMDRAVPTAERDLEALSHYLRTGILPWWAPAALRDDPSGWLRMWMEDRPDAVVAASIRPILSSVAARTRLAAELTDAPFWKLVCALSGSQESSFWKVEYAECERLLKSASQPYEKYCVACRAAVLGACLYIPDASRARARLAAELLPMLSPDARKTLRQHLAGLMEKEGEAERAAKRREQAGTQGIDAGLDAILPPDALLFSDAMVEEESREEETHYYIAGAGLVLVAPFLPAFFSNLGLLEDTRLTDPAKAVALLLYAAHKEEGFREWHSLLPKILCGVPPHTLIPTGTEVLEEAERAGADELLRSIIGHWTVLKKTSPDGLRQSFLQRDGRLTEKEAAWRLLVQPAAHDVLLQHLPWTIGIIRLPWMETPLFVDWE